MVIIHSVLKRMCHGVVIYLFLVSHSVAFSWKITAGASLYYGLELSEAEANNRRVIGRRKNTPHRAVSLQQHGCC